MNKGRTSSFKDAIMTQLAQGIQVSMNNSPLPLYFRNATVLTLPIKSYYFQKLKKNLFSTISRTRAFWISFIMVFFFFLNFQRCSCTLNKIILGIVLKSKAYFINISHTPYICDLKAILCNTFICIVHYPCYRSSDGSLSSCRYSSISMFRSVALGMLNLK